MFVLFFYLYYSLDLFYLLCTYTVYCYLDPFYFYYTSILHLYTCFTLTSFRVLILLSRPVLALVYLPIMLSRPVLPLVYLSHFSHANGLFLWLWTVIVSLMILDSLIIGNNNINNKTDLYILHSYYLSTFSQEEH